MQWLRTEERLIQSLPTTHKELIANFLLAYKSTTHSTTDRTPAGLFIGRELRTRLTLLCPSVGEKVMDYQSKQKATHDARA